MLRRRKRRYFKTAGSRTRVHGVGYAAVGVQKARTRVYGSKPRYRLHAAARHKRPKKK